MENYAQYLARTFHKIFFEKTFKRRKALTHLLENGRTTLWSYAAHELDNPGLDYALYVITLWHAKSFSEYN
jgi:hypothetical protein